MGVDNYELVLLSHIFTELNAAPPLDGYLNSHVGIVESSFSRNSFIQVSMKEQ